MEKERCRRLLRHSGQEMMVAETRGLAVGVVKSEIHLLVKSIVVIKKA